MGWERRLQPSFWSLSSSTPGSGHCGPPLPWPPAYQSQGVCCGDFGSLGVYQDQTQGSSKTAEIHVGIVQQQACQQCKARQKITLTSDSFPTPDIRTSHHICCHLSKFTGRSALRSLEPKPKGCLTHPRTLPGNHVCLFTACCTSLGKHLQLQFPKLEFGRRLIKTSILPKAFLTFHPSSSLECSKCLNIRMQTHVPGGGGGVATRRKCSPVQLVPDILG